MAQSWPRGIDIVMSDMLKMRSATFGVCAPDAGAVAVGEPLFLRCLLLRPPKVDFDFLVAMTSGGGSSQVKEASTTSIATGSDGSWTCVSWIVSASKTP